jgi:hypothetical protein
MPCRLSWFASQVSKKSGDGSNLHGRLSAPVCAICGCSFLLLAHLPLIRLCPARIARIDAFWQAIGGSFGKRKATMKEIPKSGTKRNLAIVWAMSYRNAQ